MWRYQDEAPPREITINWSSWRLAYAFAHARNGIQYSSSKPASVSHGPIRIGRLWRPSIVIISLVSPTSGTPGNSRLLAGSRCLFSFGVRMAPDDWRIGGGSSPTI